MTLQVEHLSPTAIQTKPGLCLDFPSNQLIQSAQKVRLQLLWSFHDVPVLGAQLCTPLDKLRAEYVSVARVFHLENFNAGYVLALPNAPDALSFDGGFQPCSSKKKSISTDNFLNTPFKKVDESKMRKTRKPRLTSQKIIHKVYTNIPVPATACLGFHHVWNFLRLKLLQIL